MKRSRFLPAVVLGLAVLGLLAGLRPPREPSGFRVNEFAALPVLNGGRLKPLDTVARSTLLMLRGKQTVPVEGKRLSAIEFLMDLLYRPAVAERYPVFEIDDPDVLGMIGIEQSRKRHYAFADLRPHLGSIEQQAAHAEQLRPEQRARFHASILGLQHRLLLYQKLTATLQIPGAQEVSAAYEDFTRRLAPLMTAHMSGAPAAPAKLRDLSQALDQYQFMAQVAEFLPLAGARGRNSDGWISVGQGLLDAMTNVEVHPGVFAYAALGDAYRAGRPDAFNATLDGYRRWLQREFPGELRKSRAEAFQNRVQPFMQSIVLYLVVFLLAAFSWLVWPSALNRSAFVLLALAFAVHTAGLAARMILQGRPPVTNLYSSAIFVGWGAVLLGLIVERLYRNGIGSAMAAAIGFMTLIIAHHLNTQGDTLEMMRAVLDSNFWLATHVVTITIGYSATFLAGAIAIVYILRRIFDRRWSEASAATLERMVYGIVCFSLFFSFLGTVLGGIWADQSWGRFWGWDPKENGALMIVLWTAFYLHARIGGLVRPRTLMAFAVFGNVITAFSWFGVNMLGIGLHSYGFMDKAFLWLALFTATQAVIMALAYLPDYATRRFSPVRK